MLAEVSPVLLDRTSRSMAIGSYVAQTAVANVPQDITLTRFGRSV